METCLFKSEIHNNKPLVYWIVLVLLLCVIGSIITIMSICETASKPMIIDAPPVDIQYSSNYVSM